MFWGAGRGEGGGGGVIGAGECGETRGLRGDAGVNGLSNMGDRAPADIRAKVKELPDGPAGRAGGYVSNLKKGFV